MNLARDQRSRPSSDRPRRQLAYDQDCSLCKAAVSVLIWMGLVARSDARPWDTLDPDTSARLMRVGMHNQLGVFDPLTREARGGYRGLLWKAEEGRARPVARFLGLPGLVHLGSALYRVISYNRRILAPLGPREPGCDCDPDPSPFWRGAFVVPLAAFALVTIHAHLERLHPRAGAWGLLLLALFLVIVSSVTSEPSAAPGSPVPPRRRGERALDLAGHLAWSFGLAAVWLALGLALSARVPQPVGNVVWIIATLAALSSLARRLPKRLGAGGPAPGADPHAGASTSQPHLPRAQT